MMTSALPAFLSPMTKEEALELADRALVMREGQIELVPETGMVVHVEISQERYSQLGLNKGDEVFVRLKNMRVFPQHQNVIEWGELI
jgi:ABC-type Fe3+/spermidine/putrescine transport system ATPase subunit